VKDDLPDLLEEVSPLLLIYGSFLSDIVFTDCTIGGIDCPVMFLSKVRNIGTFGLGGFRMGGRDNLLS